MVYEYKFKLTKVIDGDSIRGVCDCGFKMSVKVNGRLYGIDTEESRTRDPVTKRYGLLAKEFVKRFFKEGKSFTLESKSLDKYGRTLAVVTNEDGVCLNDELVKNHLAVAYHGQNKKEVEAEHMINRGKINAINGWSDLPHN